MSNDNSIEKYLVYICYRSIDATIRWSLWQTGAGQALSFLLRLAGLLISWELFDDALRYNKQQLMSMSENSFSPGVNCHLESAEPAESKLGSAANLQEVWDHQYPGMGR